MGRIVANVITSIDGITESPGEWGMRLFDVDAQRESLKRLLNSEAMLMGRLTYQALKAVWAGNDGPLGKRINSIKKYVFSTTLRTASMLNAEVIRGDAVVEATRLRSSASADLTIFGFGRLPRALMDAGLLDELRLLLNPVFVGTGDGLHSVHRRYDMRLASSETLPTGLVVLTYRPLIVPR
jgi:dihydrofolate reductase